MCGIAGLFNLAEERPIDQRLLEAMGERLIHRGPDDQGYYRDGRVGLSFRRLSIIDLAGGNQPLTNEDGSVIVVCNGEIYNYRELRADLEAKGHRFRTQCDVETLPHLFEEYGERFVDHLNGQFAIALYHKPERRLYLVRDQFGIAPLFYAVADGRLIFGSEIKALLACPFLPKKVDPRGLDQVLSFPGLVSPVTMFEGVRSMRPGHFVVVEPGSGEPEQREYWDLVYPLATDALDRRDDAWYAEHLAERLLRSVSLRLRADVPVACYLSGGLDSSLIAALAGKLEPNTRRAAFSIGFAERDIDETDSQAVVARALALQRHETRFDWRDISGRLHAAIRHSECPLKESYNTCSLALSESVRAHDFKVTLTGEGSDELFAGYVGYRFDQRRAESPEDLYDPEVMMERQLRQQLWGDPDLFYEKNQFEFRETKLALYGEGLRARFNDFDSCRDLVDKSKLQGRHRVHQRSYLDFKLRLADHLISDHGDRLAYANSIEARYPFLDVDLISFATTIPPDLKLRGLTEKYILKRAAEPYLPADIIHREKFGFVAPGSPYLLRRGIDWVEDTLSHATVKRQGYFDPDVVERLKTVYRGDGFRLNLPFDSDLLMVALTFGMFLDAFDMPAYS